jgi:CHRD domain
MLRSLACCLALATIATAQTSYWAAFLDGAQETPATVTNGGGWGVVRLVEPANSVNIFVHVESLGSAATAAHMHVGGVGIAGGIIVPLAGGPADWSGSAVLSAANVTALKNAGTYLNVHTAVFPNGEVRGQVVASLTTRFAAVLNGAQETPPNPSTATGTGIAFLHEPSNRVVYTVSTNGLVNVTAAHIHQAPATVAGPVIVPLNGIPGQYCGVSDRLTAAQVTALKANGMYFNVHTAAFPNGEIRGQMILGVDDFGGPMTGAQETPPNASTGTGHATVQLQPNGTLTYSVVVAGMTGPPTAAHIHMGAIGIAGPVIIPLSGGPAVYTGTSGVLTTTQINDLRNGLYYANVHTAVFPNGELRGQLLALKLPAAYAGGCPGSNGVRPEIAADGAPSLGSGFQIECHGALAGTLAIWNVGFSRDANGAVNLPVALTSLAFPAPNCFVVASLGSTVASITDPLGCAHHTVNVPANPALTGMLLYSQWFLFDAAANPFGFTTSNGLDLQVQ